MSRVIQRAALAAIALVAATAVTGSACAQAIVVRTTGPSTTRYPKGTKLAAGASISLQEGDVLTVLDKVGTRVLCCAIAAWSMGWRAR